MIPAEQPGCYFAFHSRADETPAKRFGRGGGPADGLAEYHEIYTLNSSDSTIRPQSLTKGLAANGSIHFADDNRPATPLSDAQLGGYFFAQITRPDHRHMTPYVKPARDLATLYTKITGRGLTVTTPAELQAALENLGSYRLGGYA